HGNDIPGATNSVLVIESARETDSGPFSVTVTNRLGVLSGGAILWVSPVVSWSPVRAPSEYYPPFGTNDIVSVASTYSSSCGIRRNGTPVEWDVNGQALSLPAGLTNLQTITSGGQNGVVGFTALKQDGTVITFGSGGNFQLPPDSS